MVAMAGQGLAREARGARPLVADLQAASMPGYGKPLKKTCGLVKCILIAKIIRKNTVGGG